MIQYTTADTEQDLKGILALQKANLPHNLSAEEIQSEGFVTVDHSYEQLKNLNDREKHIIAKDGDRVAGYVLAMTPQAKQDIPVLIPLFDTLDNMLYRNKKISESPYIVTGQVCVDKAYRGQGIIDGCYAAYKKQYSSKYDFVITEIAATNPRSLKAHKRIGFTEIHSYSAPGHPDWVIVLWDWKQG